MALQLLSAFLVGFAASAALGDEISEENTKLLIEAVKVQNATVAYLSSVDDPRLKCLTSWVPVYEPENHFAVYRYHYQGQNGEPGADVDYCLNMTATESFTFGFDLCEDGAISSTAQGLYFNGKNCFVGRFPILGNDYCLLWVKTAFKDSVPEECVTEFDKQCGPESYALYDQQQCS
ncbi:uncharacterized protein LOC144119241 [Amblyomma americanum]